MNVFLSRQSLRANYLQVLNGGKLQSIWMWKNFAFPIPCATFFFLSVAERMHLASFFFLMFSFSSYPHPPTSSPKPPSSPRSCLPLKTLGSPGDSMAGSAEGSIVLNTIKWDSTPVRKRGKVGISMKSKHVVKTWRAKWGRQQETSFGGLKLKCIYTLNNTLITAISQLLSFEYRDNRILQAT